MLQDDAASLEDARDALEEIAAELDDALLLALAEADSFLQAQHSSRYCPEKSCVV